MRPGRAFAFIVAIAVAIAIDHVDLFRFENLMVDSMRSQKSDSPDFGRSLMVPFAHANFARDMRLMRQKTIITHRCLWNGVFPGMYNKNPRVVIHLLVWAA